VYENKKGPKAFKLKETDANIKLMAKDEKDVYIHIHHPETFRSQSLSKLNESDEFIELFKDWIKMIKSKYIQK